MVAYDFPLLGIWWSMMIFFLWLAWIVLLVRTFADIFRNHKLGGWSKAFWSIFVIVVPFLGVIVYLIAHGDGMGRRGWEQFEALDQGSIA